MIGCNQATLLGLPQGGGISYFANLEFNVDGQVVNDEQSTLLFTAPLPDTILAGLGDMRSAQLWPSTNDKVLIISGEPFTLTARFCLDAYGGSSTYPSVCRLQTDGSEPFQLSMSNLGAGTPGSGYKGLLFGSPTVWHRTQTGIILSTGVFHTVEVAYDGGNPLDGASFTCKVDGVPQSIIQSSPLAVQANSSVLAGDGGAASYFNGDVDYIRITKP